jgi:hypothetical protein
MELSMPRNEKVWPPMPPSAVWLYTTSRMTSMPARVEFQLEYRLLLLGPEENQGNGLGMAGEKGEIIPLGRPADPHGQR